MITAEQSNGQSAVHDGQLAHIDPTAGPRNKLVRDLWWMMASPGMLRETDATSAARPLHDAVGASIVDASRGWLARLDEDPSELEAYLAAPSRRSTRLGFYAQSLVEFWIERCPALRTTQLRCGQQLRRGQRGVRGHERGAQLRRESPVHVRLVPVHLGLVGSGLVHVRLR